MPAPRSKVTCNQCRARKVRCPGGPPPCVACKRLDFDCSFDDSAPGPSSSTTVDKKRGARACTQCRSLKTKCTGEQPSCASCLASSKTCSYLEPKKAPKRLKNASLGSSQRQQRQQTYAHSPTSVIGSMGAASVPPSVCTTTESPLISRREDPGSASYISTVSSKPNGAQTHRLPPLRDRLHLINDYFRYLFPTPYYSFLYEEATIQRCLEETMDETLMYAICAITAGLLEYPRYAPEAAASWATKVEDTIWQNIEHPTVPRIQALLLVVNYRIHMGNFQRGFMLFSIASRAATALRLNYERTDVPPIAQEIRRRLMWSLTLTDGHLSIGLPEAEACSPEAVQMKMPCPEEVFNADTSDGDQVTPGLDGVAENGLLPRLIEQYRIRRDLARLKRELQIAQQPVMSLESMINSFIATLERMPLPRYSTAELQRYSRSRWMSRYVMFHLGWHQCHCDAYRLFLRGYPEAAPSVVLASVSENYIADAVAICLHHAKEIIRILQDVADLTPTLRISCTEPSICGYHASRLVLYISRSDQNPPDTDNTPESSLESAQSTVAILKSMHSSSAIGQLIVIDLQRIIQSTVSGQDHTTSRDSSDLDIDTTSRQPRYARVAKRYQGLGAHSILKNARFLDDSAQAAERSVNPASRHKATSVMNEGLQSPSNQQQEGLGNPWRQQVQPWGSMPDLDQPSFVGSGFEASPGEQLTTIPDGTFDYALFGSDPWFSWSQGNGYDLDNGIVHPENDFF